MINSPELAKELCIKYFDSFTDHRVILDEKVDVLFGKSLISLKGEKWRNMRATLSPAFTGSKMRKMFDLIRVCSTNSIATIQETMPNEKEFEMKDFFTNFTVDVIATCAFGLEVNSFKNPKNEFKEIALKSSRPNGFLLFVKMIGIMMFPKLMRMLDIGFLEKSTSEFFRTTITGAMKYREANSITRPDMIQLLMEAKKGKLKTTEEDKTTDGFATVEESDIGKGEVNRDLLTDDDLVAQCLVFFLAGKCLKSLF